MTRKDNDKDSERPHYYSQFWLDVAAGKRIIGAPKTNDEFDMVEPELTEPATARKASAPRHTATVGDGYRDLHSPVAEPVLPPEEFEQPESEEALPASDEEELYMQNTYVEDTEIPDVDLSHLEEENLEEDFLEEEEEDDEEWNSRGRKKPKPGRQTKQPPRKTNKRDNRRGSF